MNITNVAMPSLIAPDLVLTVPMTSYTGYITYLSYEVGSNKGDMYNGVDANGDDAGSATVFEDPFHIGKPDEKRTNYTSSKVSFDAQPTCDKSGAVYNCIALRWSPVVIGSIELAVSCDNGTNVHKYVDFACDTDPNSGILAEVGDGIVKQTIVDQMGNVKVMWIDTATGKEAKLGSGFTQVPGAKVLYGTTRDDRFNSARIGEFPLGNHEIKSAGISGLGNIFNGDNLQYTLAYNYNNQYIPQNDIPLLNARVKGIALIARARRIAMNRYVA